MIARMDASDPRPFEVTVTADDDPDRTAVGSAAELAATVAEKSRSQRPWLVTVRGRGSSHLGRMFCLEDRLVVGRSTECDVQLDGGGVSRRHTMLERKPDDSIEVVDLGSRNGTFVNGEKVERATVRDGDKIQVGWSVVFRLTFQDELDEGLQRSMFESARRDALTGATNTRGFNEALSREHSFATRHGRLFSLLAFDIDHFKRVNDTHGHAAGDFVLRRIVEIVTAAIRREDLLARLGGEEFVILLRDIPLSGAVECAERIRAAVERGAFDGAGGPIPVTISLGAATLDRARHTTPASLLESADRALYEAKRSGRNRVCKAESPGL
jgi:diguanylate cyclase (GGDEF)-like protein